MMQAGFLRLDVDVGGAHADRILEHGLQQLDDRRVFDRRRQPSAPKSTAAFAQLLAELLREPADLLGAAIDAVDGLQQHDFR